MRKRIAVISDPHCGSRVGLTPPYWQGMVDGQKKRKNDKFRELQKVAWDWYVKEIASLGEIDVAFLLADLVDGQDRKGGGVGQITTDMDEQCEMAIEAITPLKAKKIVCVYGSGYHVTSRDGDDYELRIARHFNAPIGNHEFVEVNGVLFNLKHKQSRSGVPHARGTLLHKQKLWEQMWADYKGFPNSDVLLRGHAHYFYAIQDTKYLMMALPCLKTLGDKFGGRNFIDMIDYGFVDFVVEDDGTFDWTMHIANFERQKQKIRRL